MAGKKERRQYPRFQVGEGAFAFINNIPFSIMNISTGGMNLQTVLFEDILPEQMTMDIFMKHENFYLQDVPVRLVRVRNVFARTPFMPTQYRCFGLQFGELTEQQKTRIDYFISHCSLLKV